VWICACLLIVRDKSSKDFHSRRQEDKCKEFLFIKFTLTTCVGRARRGEAMKPKAVHNKSTR
jgi:hypothetical protein